ncbi:MAG: hypothetical protein GX238_04885 [Epulopiscium sp.]|nr:hypothetical protein [Candidatus Epulonipiscium sp.]
MNWMKVKNILIVLFLVLNSVLGIYYYSKQYQTYTLSSDRMEQVQTILQHYQVEMKGKIVTTFYPMQKLRVELAKYEDKILLQGFFQDKQMVPYIESQGRRYIQGEEELWISRQEGDMVGSIIYTNPQGRGKVKSLSLEDVKEVGDEFVKAITGEKGKFRLDRTERTEEGYHLEYREMYKGWLLFNSTIEVEVTKKGVVWGQRLRYQPMGFQGEKKEIYAPDEVLLNFLHFIREKDPLGRICIVQMDLGYDTGTKDSTRDIYGIAVPYYRIVLDTGEVYYVNGYKNEIRQ